MKSINLLLGVIFLALSIGVCLIIDSIGMPTLIVSSSVIVATTLLVFISSAIKQKTAFKVSVPFFLVFNGIAGYTLSFYIGDTVKNDWHFISILALFAIQVSVLLITSAVSRLNNER